MSWAFLTCYRVQSAPYRQRRSAGRWAPVRTAQKGCWLLVRACSSSTSIRTTDDVGNQYIRFKLPPGKNEVLLNWISVIRVCDFTPPTAPCFLMCSRSGLYSNTEQANVYLTRSSPVSLSQSIQYSSRTIYLCWHYLTDAVRSVLRSGPPPNFTVERVYGTIVKGVTFPGNT